MLKRINLVLSISVWISLTIDELPFINTDISCLEFENQSRIINNFSNGPLYSANERIFLQFKTIRANAPLLFVGSNDSYYVLSLQSGLIKLGIRLPAEVISHEPDDIPSTTSTTLRVFQWFQSARAGHLSVHDTLSTFTGFESRLDNGQIHDLSLERTSDQIRVTIDNNVAYYQQLSFDKIRAGFLEIQSIILGSFPHLSSIQESFSGQVTHAILQVDDATLNILDFAEKSLHGFEFDGTNPINCTTSEITSPSVSMRRTFLLLRFPSQRIQSYSPPLFNEQTTQAKRIRNWQQIEIDFESKTKDGFLFLIFNKTRNMSSPFLGAEMRDGSLWLVTRKQSLKVHTKQLTPFSVGMGRIAISGQHMATVIAIGNAAIEYYVAIDGDEFRSAFEAEIAGILETATEWEDNELLFGRNILLGGSNWTIEEEFARSTDRFWSGLGRRKEFSGCIKRLALNGELVNFEPIVNSHLRYYPLRRGQLLHLGCQNIENCACENGGVCEDGECNCLRTAFTGDRCQIPAKILNFDLKRQLRMRFPVAHRLESTEIQFAFKTKVRNATLLSTYTQGTFSPKSYIFGPVHSDGMSIYLAEGLLVVMTLLSGRLNTLKVPFADSGDNWHALRIIRTGFLLRVHLDSTIYEKNMLEGDVEINNQWRNETEAFVTICLGSTSNDIQEEVLDGDNLIMQIQEVGVGQKTTTTNAPFVGQIRHFMFNGIDPLSEPRYLVETPLLKWLSPSPAMQIEHAITLKTPECFLRLPRLSVYGAFRVSFAIKTRQEDGVVLFNSGGGDFILVELVNAHLTISFDMGHGTALKYQRIGRDHLSDGKWHKITISRNGPMDEILHIEIKSDFEKEEVYNLKIPSMKSARNFDFNEPLYIGGIPANMRLRFAEKILSKYGMQGCVGSFEVNNQTNVDILTVAETVMGENRTSAFCKSQVVRGCLKRSSEALTCSEFAQQKRIPYCLNGGVCLHFWTSLRCSCEMTTFTGSRCHLPGTSIKFGKNSSDDSDNPMFVKYTYLRDQQKTNRDEIALGFQVAQPFTPSIYNLLYVETSDGNVDFLHIYLEDGIVNLAFDLGGGLIQLKEIRKRLNDGNYHRIRVFRHGLATLLEVDGLTTKYVSEGPLGEQFNEQKSIWLGHAPVARNFTSAFQGVLSGVFYNGLLLCDLAAGLSLREDVHVTRHPGTHYLANFQISLGVNSFFQQLPNIDLMGPEVNSYHDDSAANSALNSNFPILASTNSAIPTDIGSQFIREWIQFPLGQSSDVDSTVTPALLKGHVNIWLFICLGLAGMALLTSLFFFSFHYFQRRHRPLSVDGITIR